RPPGPSPADGFRLRRADQAGDHVAAPDDHPRRDADRRGGAAALLADRGDPARRRPRLRRRQRPQLLPRPRHRRPDVAHPPPGLGGGPGLPRRHPGLRRRPDRPRRGRALVGRQPAGRGAGAGREPLLRLRLHPLAEAPHPAEHRHRRRRRGGPPARRLGGRHRRPLAPGLGALRGHLPLDAAPLLVPGAAEAGGVRPGRGADAAERGRRGGDAQADRRLHASAGAPLCCPHPLRPRPPLPGRHGRGQRRLPALRGPPLPDPEQADRPRHVLLQSLVPGARLRRGRGGPPAARV
ncbi:MAG: Heme O synthase, protoheme IX farnesyltransferase COX10-CtaB, partial [uncultured Thermomicrobiales bacterium]